MLLYIFFAQFCYFENVVVGQITEPWFVVFWATFMMYRGRPMCI